tara:strand:- start:20 stop:1075 length:1056 start_codon:yes stop_codon:yes gene_type:complete
MDFKENQNVGTMEVLERHQFNEKALSSFMEENVEGFEGPLSIEEFKGGQSNPTYLIKTKAQSYVLRRKPPGKLLKSAHAVDREYRVITALNNTNVPVPRTYTLCENTEIIGTAFYLMEFMDGRVLWDPSMENSSTDEAKGVYTSMNNTLAKLHSVDPIEVDLESFGRPGNYVGRQVSIWSKQYVDSETEEIPEMNKLIDWFPNNLPSDKPLRIVHGDFSLSNLMMHNDRPEVIAILDWELSTLGDPCADFSYHCMQYRMNPNLSNQDYCKKTGIPAEEEYVAMYCDKTGFDLKEEWELYMAYNIFKSAGILQGILGRVRDGTAASKHAKDMAARVRPLAESAWKLIEENFI